MGRFNCIYRRKILHGNTNNVLELKLHQSFITEAKHVVDVWRKYGIDVSKRWNYQSRLIKKKVDTMFKTSYFFGVFGMWKDIEINGVPHGVWNDFLRNYKNII